MQVLSSGSGHFDRGFWGSRHLQCDLESGSRSWVCGEFCRRRGQKGLKPRPRLKPKGRAARDPLPRPTIQLASALGFCHCQEMRLNTQSVMWKEDKVHPSDPLPTHTACCKP